ncbi:MAG: hypothetical protein DBX61_11235 [Clostridiales bacterium]|nr:MAG: hypothetical protein DBX61_11235 [Clostridiales bacterium]
MNEGLIYLYGALPHTPHAFFEKAWEKIAAAHRRHAFSKKAWEKAFFADKYPAHFIRAILVGFILFMK